MNNPLQGPDPASPDEVIHFPWKFEWVLFGRMLKASRQTQRLTLRATADICGMMASTLMRMERGQPAALDSVVSACEFMGLMVDAFVSRPGQPDGHFVSAEADAPEVALPPDDAADA